MNETANAHNNEHANANERKLRDYLNRVTIDLRDTRRRLRDTEARHQEPIAVVSMSCRFPGGVRTPEELWDLLVAGRDTVTGVPGDRGWDTERLHAGGVPCRGAFIDGAADFDADFFAVSPHEAVAMDPQQRLLLQAAWEAVERAGIDPAALRTTRTGVFAAAIDQGYAQLGTGAPDTVQGFLMTGNSMSVMSGRVAYALGLEGPAVTVDTACSASLVALHQAARALRAGECVLALVGGVTVMSRPSVFTEFSRQGAMSADGRCKPFSASADGTGWGEGVGMLLLERLSDARRNGHPVLAVVRGSAVNQDGASNGLTAPNGPSQQRVIRAALADAGLTAADIDAVEAHGTGTRLGDPIEADALLATYGRDRPTDHPLWVGSVKSNIGHTQAAAGIAGVIKTVLALRHGLLPRSLHITEPTPHADWTAGSVALLTEARPWPGSGRPRRAGVSSFGMSGTNAHVIVEQAPPNGAADGPDGADGTGEDGREPEGPATAPDGWTAVPCVLSGRTAAALRDQAIRLDARLAADPAARTADIGFSLATTRTAFEHRAVVLAAGPAELRAGAAALTRAEGATGDQPHVGSGTGPSTGPSTGPGAGPRNEQQNGQRNKSWNKPQDGTSAATVVITGCTAPHPRRVALVFPGQGGQWPGMGSELLDSSPVFAASLVACADALAPYVDWSLLDVVRGAVGAPGLDRVDVVQPALFAVMLSLAELWRSWGVEPDAVVGHSQGEIAAAVVAGALSLEDGAKVVALRSRAIASLAGKGGMVSLALPRDRAEKEIAPWGGRIAVAAVNGPAAVVVSGDREALDLLLAACGPRGIRARDLPVDYASHSVHVERVRDELLTALTGITPRSARIPLYSTVTGDRLDTATMDAGYWYRNLRRTVRFDTAVRALLRQGHDTFVEVSPHPVLTVPVADTADDAAEDTGAEDTAAEATEAAGAVGTATTVVTGTLRRDEGDLRRALTSAAELWVHGTPVDWHRVFDGSGARRVDLPTYPFQQRRHWLEPSAPDTVGTTEDSAFWDLVERDDLTGAADALAVDTGPLGQVLPALRTWRTRHRETSAADTWRYRVDWQPLPDPPATTLTGTWLVLLPTGHTTRPTASAAARALTEHGADVLTAEAGPGILTTGDAEHNGEGSRAGDDDSRFRLAATIEAACGERSLSGVLSLLALDSRPHPRHPALPTGTALTLVLVQALGDLGVTAPLWCVTTGAVSTGPDDPLTAPDQALVWGTGMVAALEHPARWGGLVDLPPQPDHRTRERLCAALSRVTTGGTGAGTGTEDQLAIRPAGLLARRLVRAPRRTPRSGHPWQPRGTVLLTGGTGAIGPHIARWLARGGADHLVLPGRRGAEAPGAAELSTELAGHGTRLTFPVCDLADREQTERLLAGLEAQGTPVTAVVHAAARIALAPLDTVSVAEFADTVAAKAAGARHLDALLDRELDAFVLFSSIAGVWGSGDHGAYSAANAYLDALAHRRRGRGLTATTVDWGVWRPRTHRPPADAGSDLFNLEEHGVPRIDPERAITALQQILDDDETHLAVADVDWERFAPVFTSSRPSPLIHGVPEARRALSAPPSAAPAPAASALRERLTALRPADRSRLLLDLVRGHAAAVLGHDSTEAVPPGRAFQELGFASLTAVELRNRLTTATGLRLPSTLVYDHPSATALAAHLATLLLDGIDSTPPPGDGTAPVPNGSQQDDSQQGDRERGGRHRDDPVAIVSMGCRLPGGITTPDQLWKLLVDQGDAISTFPTGRGWDLDELYDPDPDHPGTVTTRHGGFLHDADLFDAAFFGVSPREAVAMDPQQRLLLETTWEAIERAGIDPTALRGSRTGVFTGVNYSDYASAVARSAQGDGHLLTGSAPSVVSGRVAYTLGLEGPAITVDTACSSSLVALHLAVRALRAGDCSLALVGGVTVMSTPGALVSFSRQRGLAADGRCKAFADSADGMGMSEGAGVLLVERLSDARRNGHPVLAVVRGSAVNQDGASNGLTAPNGPSQQRVIRAALADAGLSAADVDMVEAHGTGTTLGDPIEAQALLATYGQGRSAGRPLWLGSLKSNIGHTQALSGVAGVMKTVLALRHARIPATLHADRPTAHVDWTQRAVALATDSTPWPDTGRPRRAGVSSFGLSGTNVHVVLEEVPEVSVSGVSGRSCGVGVVPWVLSGRSSEALCAVGARLLERVVCADAPAAVDVGLSLTGRTAFTHRAVLVGDDRSLPSTLEEWSNGGFPARCVSGVQVTDPRVVFVFPGQGSQWVGMACELLDVSPVFAARMGECERALGRFVDWSLTGVVRSGVGLGRVDVVQPVLWAVMVSLASVWRGFGVVPAAVVGHSQGEIAAAVVAGALSLEDGARVVALRSRAIASLAGEGGMVAVSLPVGEVERLIGGWEGRLSVAAVNSPSSVVVSGDSDALAGLLVLCGAEGVRARRVEVDYASHSARVERIEAEIRTALEGVTPVRGGVPLFSTAMDAWLDTSVMGGAYWYANLRRTVGFESAVRALAAEGFGPFVEVSPHPVLAVAVEETLEAVGSSVPVIGTLRRDEGGMDRLLLSLGQAWVHGLPVDWSPVFAGTGATGVDLPTYPFQHQSYWAMPDPAISGGGLVAAGLGTTGHPLLGASVAVAETGELLLTGRISLRTHPWLADHTVSDTTLLPGTAFVELAVRAGDEAGCPVLEELTLQTPLVLPATGGLQLQLRVGAPDGTGRRSVDIFSRPEAAPEVVPAAPSTPSTPPGSAVPSPPSPLSPLGPPSPPGSLDFPDFPWTVHATGVLTREPANEAPPPEDGIWPPPGAEPVDVTGLYERFAAAGHHYGPAFQGIRAAWRRDGEIFTEVGLPQDQHTGAAGFNLHPALLDAALQGLWLTADGSEPDTEKPGTVRLPFSWTGVTLHASGATGLRVRLDGAAGGPVSFSASDPSGRPVVTVAGLVARPVDPAALRAPRAPAHDSLFRLEWTPVPAAAVGHPPAADRWAALGPEGLLPCTHPDLAALTDALARGSSVPDAVLVPCRTDGDDAGAVRAAVRDALTLLQSWVSDDRFADTRLVFVTTGAVRAVPGDPVTDLGAAAVRGLVRSAQSEYPGRFVLVDAPDQEALLALLPAALGLAEPQLAVRGGRLLAARLARVPAPDSTASDTTPADGTTPGGAAPDTPFHPDGTVLVTGAGGALGGLVARHLAAAHGVRRLLLAGRRGARTPGAPTLLADLEALGAHAEFATCDVADRTAVAELLARVPGEHPLTAVVHAAGALDDGTLAALTSERIDHVLCPKADAALHLHELTKHLPLSAFVLFSSAAGIIGNAGQANYAAANAFLDALAHCRRAEGLPAQSLAWGLWERRGGMTGTLDAAGLRRMTRGGVSALSDAEGLALFDTALRLDDALLVPVRLRPGAASGPVPPLLRGLVRGGPARRTAAGAGPAGAVPLRAQLAVLGTQERLERLVDLVRARAADVLGYTDAGAIDPERAFKELGFDSLTAVDLRNRLNAETGLRLPATLVFDHPSPTAVAAFVAARLAPPAPGPATPAGDENDPVLRQRLAAIPLSRLRAAGLLDALLRLTGPDRPAEHDATGPALAPADVQDALDVPQTPDTPDAIRAMAVDDLVRLALGGGERV